MSKTFKYILFGLLGLLVLVLILRALGVIGKKNAGTEVSVSEAKKRDIYEYVSATGKAYPVDEVSISSDVSGEIVNLYVQEGQYVERGQVLARIQASTYRSAVDRSAAMLEQNRASVKSAQSQVASAKVNYDKAKREYDRYTKLYEEKVISLAEYESYQNAYLSAKTSLQTARDNVSINQQSIRSAKSTLDEAQENLSKTVIRAPMSGVITQLNVEAGERVVGTATMTGTEMMRISNMEQMEIRVTIGENDVVKIKNGDTAIVELEAYLEQPLNGSVSRISNSTGNSTGGISLQDQAASYMVYIQINPLSYARLREQGNSNPVRPGMSATGKIYTAMQKSALSVPFAAVTTRMDTASNSEEKKECVFVLSEDAKSVHLRFVQTGILDDKYIQITQGLKAGEKVVEAPFSAISKLLEDESKVKVVDKEDLFEEEE